MTASRAQATAPSGAQADEVLYDVEGGVATITLNDPETRNALSAELIEGLISSLQRAREEEQVRCVVLCSSH